jgi:hypothetical protein
MLMERWGLQIRRTRSNLSLGSVMAIICLVAATDDFFWDGDHVNGVATLSWGIGSLLLAYNGYLVRCGDERTTSKAQQLGYGLLLIAFLVWALG